MDGADAGTLELSEQAIAARVTNARMSRAEAVLEEIMVDGNAGQAAKVHVKASRDCDASRMREGISQQLSSCRPAGKHAVMQCTLALCGRSAFLFA